MNGTALILAAHGSGDGSPVNHRVRAIARRIADGGRFDEVVAAFRLGRPGFAEVLDTIAADECVVVPLMVADGHFSSVVLPAELARNARYADVAVRITPPVGAHPAIADAVRARIGVIVDRHQLPRHDTAVVIVGHGTPRHDAGRRAAESLARDVAGLCAQSLVAFLDESPRLEGACRHVDAANVIVIPFVIGGGHHAIQDIPARLDAGLARFPETPLPSREGLGEGRNHRRIPPHPASPPKGERGNGGGPSKLGGNGLRSSGERFVVCDIPVGEYEVIPDVVVSLATAETSELHSASLIHQPAPESVPDNPVRRGDVDCPSGPLPYASGSLFGRRQGSEKRSTASRPPPQPLVRESLLAPTLRGNPFPRTQRAVTGPETASSPAAGAVAAASAAGEIRSPMPCHR